MTKLQDFLNSPVSQIAPAARMPSAGDLFGIEVECEGKNVGHHGDLGILEDWAPHADGSLRPWKGFPPCEWVFNGPVSYKRSVDRVNKLYNYFEKNKAQLVTSNRTSVHVHFNMGDKTAYQLVNTFILFTILEDILDTYCGEDRRGNLFCLSSRYAEGQIRWVEESIFKNYRFRFNDNWRYCSLNLASLNKFGTIEFRGMRGLDNKEDLLAWLSIINELVSYSCYTMKNPVDLIEGISMKTPMGFLKEVFSADNVKRLTAGRDEGDINNSIYEGLRLVQMMCYKIGTEFDQVRLRGKDFWASFGGQDNEPQKDIDPAEFMAGRKAPKVRGGVDALDAPGLFAPRQRARVIRAEAPRQPAPRAPEPFVWDLEADAPVAVPLNEAGRGLDEIQRQDRDDIQRQIAEARERMRREALVREAQRDAHAELNRVRLHNPFVNNNPFRDEDPF